MKLLSLSSALVLVVALSGATGSNAEGQLRGADANRDLQSVLCVTVTKPDGTKTTTGDCTTPAPAGTGTSTTSASTSSGAAPNKGGGGKKEGHGGAPPGGGVPGGGAPGGGAPGGGAPGGGAPGGGGGGVIATSAAAEGGEVPCTAAGDSPTCESCVGVACGYAIDHADCVMDCDTVMDSECFSLARQSGSNTTDICAMAMEAATAGGFPFN